MDCLTLDKVSYSARFEALLDCRPIVEADRGIGNSSQMMCAVDRLGLSLVFRIKQNGVLRTHWDINITSAI